MRTQIFTKSVGIATILLAGIIFTNTQAQAWQTTRVCTPVKIRAAESVKRNQPLMAGMTYSKLAMNKTVNSWRRKAIPAIVSATRNAYGIGRVATSPPANKSDRTLQAIVYNNSLTAPSLTVAKRCWRKGLRQKCSFIAQACATVELNR